MNPTKVPKLTAVGTVKELIFKQNYSVLNVESPSLILRLRLKSGGEEMDDFIPKVKYCESSSPYKVIVELIILTSDEIKKETQNNHNPLHPQKNYLAN